MRRAAGLALLTAAVVAGCGSSERPTAVSEWTAHQPAKLSRTEVGAARVGGAIYVVGGFRKVDGKTTAAVERYDLQRDEWRIVHAMPIALNHAAAASHGGRLYVVGGYTAPNGLASESARLLRYDPATDRWKELRPMPKPRAALAVAVVGDHLYAVGGARGGKALRRLDVYDFSSNEWRAGPPMHTAREHLAATAAGGFVYVLAGRAAGKGNFDVLERYDPQQRTWTTLPHMAKTRGGIAAATRSGRIVVFGGEENAGTIREVELYDPASRKWSSLPDMRTPRHGLGGVSFGKRVYAVEGGPQPGLHFSRAIESLHVP
jgi:N-acetylneuraminic acid mutarotase